MDNILEHLKEDPVETVCYGTDAEESAPHVIDYMSFRALMPIKVMHTVSFTYDFTIVTINVPSIPRSLWDMPDQHHKHIKHLAFCVEIDYHMVIQQLWHISVYM